MPVSTPTATVEREVHFGEGEETLQFCGTVEVGIWWACDVWSVEVIEARIPRSHGFPEVWTRDRLTDFWDREVRGLEESVEDWWRDVGHAEWAAEEKAIRYNYDGEAA